jgi:type VI secretion system protein ImpH
MAAAGGGAAAGVTPSVRDRLFAEFYEFDFFQAVRLLERVQPGRRPVGRDHAPADEVARFRPHLSLAFPPSQIVALDPSDEDRSAPLVTVTFFGLYGVTGVLPVQYTQLLLDLGRDVRGPERRSLRDWLDLFNHRATSLFYRAWEKYRFYVAYDRGDARGKEPDTFTLAVRSLMGLGSPGLGDRLEVRTAELGARTEDELRRTDFGPALRASSSVLARVDDLALLYYAGFFAQRPRNAANLRLLLADYFAVAVEVCQFRGQWLAVPEADQTRLGAMGVLGVDAVAGSHVWDCASRFRVRLGPLSYARFDDLLPDPAPAPARKTFFMVAQLARLFAGPELDFDVQLVLAADQVPETELTDGAGAGPHLGWNVWLISEAPAAPADDAVFETDWVTTLGLS